MTPKTPKIIKVFSSKTCVPCHQLKACPDSKGVIYTVVDRELDPLAFSEIVELTNTQLVPQLLVNGVPIVGLNYGRTRELLGL